MSGLVENLGDLMKPFLVEAFLRKLMPQGGHDIGDSPLDRCAIGLRAMFAMLLEPFEQRFNFLSFFLQMGTAFPGCLERLAARLALPFLDQSHVLEQSERRINDSRAWRVVAAGQLLDRPDKIVTVSRLVGDQLEQDESQLATFEHPSAPATMTAAAAAAAAFVPEFEVESARAETESARSAYRENSGKSVFRTTAASMSMHI